MLTAAASEVDELRVANEAWARWGARAQSDLATLRADRDAAHDLAARERAQRLDVLGRCVRAEHDAREATERAAGHAAYVELLRTAVLDCGHPEGCAAPGIGPEYDGRPVCGWCQDRERLTDARSVVRSLREELRETMTLRRDGVLVLDATPQIGEESGR